MQIKKKIIIYNKCLFPLNNAQEVTQKNKVIENEDED